MEIKEFENPEKTDYDIKGRLKSIKTQPNKVDNSFNSDNGIDLNALYEYKKSLEMANNNERHDDFDINGFGEIIRPEGKSR